MLWPVLTVPSHHCLISSDLDAKGMKSCSSGILCTNSNTSCSHWLCIRSPCRMWQKPRPFGLDTLQLQYVEQGWGEPQANRSVDGHPVLLDGKRFEHGLGTHANSIFRIALGGKAERFTATVGVDDEVGKQGSVVFKVTGDGKTLWESGVLRGRRPGQGRFRGPGRGQDARADRG